MISQVFERVQLPALHQGQRTRERRQLDHKMRLRDVRV
jgi:hypothetical protein